MSDTESLYIDTLTKCDTMEPKSRPLWPKTSKFAAARWKLNNPKRPEDIPTVWVPKGKPILKSHELKIVDYVDSVDREISASIK